MTTGEKTFWGVFAAVVIIIFGGALFWRSAHPVTSSSNFTSTTAAALSASDWSRGNAQAKVSVIEYGDFQCPACGAYEPIVEKLTQKYGSSVRFVFRHFPLYQIHPNAGIAAQAVEAAGVQGKFWEMHDLLYAKQNEWSSTPTDTVVAKNFNTYAQSLGLNLTKFDADIESAAVKAKIQRDVDSGNAAQVNHTPTFFVNLAQIENPQSEEAFSAVIDAAIASSTAR
jgi:protein-disulfide isomerase